jgi:lysophospholipase L1-like esterase
LFRHNRALSTSTAAIIATALLTTMAAGAAAAQPVTYPPTTAGTTSWVGAWASAQQSPIPESFFGTNWSVDGFSNHTVRQVIRISTGGTQTRIRLSNVYGTTALRLTGASVAKAGEGGMLRPGTQRPVTFGHRTSTVLPAGEQRLSDPIWLATSPLEQLAVTLYFAEATGPASFHEAGMTTTYRATGDHRYDTSGIAFAETSHSWYYLAGVDVAGRFPPPNAVVTLGDSITDGVSSTSDANNRYPDELAERLVAAGKPMGVLNAGISGNRVLNDSPCFGEKATARFQRDVLDQARVRTVIVLEGINDIQASAAPFDCFAPHDEVSAEQLIAGYQALIDAAHARGIRIIGATITPYQGSWFYTDQGEAVRDAVNDWIRTSGQYDAVVDLARALADPNNPDQLRPEYDAGDKLHPNDAGLHALANAIDLNTL